MTASEQLQIERAIANGETVLMIGNKSAQTCRTKQQQNEIDRQREEARLYRQLRK